MFTGNAWYGMGEKTSVEIDRSTRKDLKLWKTHRDETYDEAINSLLKIADEAEEADR